MGDKKVTGSQLLDTQVITETDLTEDMRSYKAQGHRTIGFIFGFVLIIMLFSSILYFSSIMISKSQKGANKRIDITIDQLNDVLLPALEEHIMELNARIDALAKDAESLKDNCTDIRYIIAPKFGKSALVPIRRLKTAAIVEEKVKLPKVKVPREQ